VPPTHNVAHTNKTTQQEDDAAGRSSRLYRPAAGSTAAPAGDPPKPSYDRMMAGVVYTAESSVTHSLKAPGFSTLEHIK
jgi:hypothetical protein